MKNANSHIVLYAKGHYKRSNMMDDLKILVANRSGLEPDQIFDTTVFDVIYNIAYPFLTQSFLRSVILDSFGDNNSKFYIEGNDQTSLAQIIERLLVIISMIGVLDDDGNTIYELDEPDYSILPKPKKGLFSKRSNNGI